MSESEIARYLGRGKENIYSLEGFADELQSLFPYKSGQKTAILFYIFNNDTLFRYFLTPGTILEQKAIPIKKEELEQLNKDVLSALNIYKLVENRAPRERGLKLKKEPGKSVPKLQDVIQKATELLIPSSFDEKFQHLIVIPSFSIGVFPFQLLQPYKDSAYLIDKCSFSIAPSLLDLVAIRKRMTKSRNGEYLRGDNEWRSVDSIAFTFDNPLFVCNPFYPKNTKFIFPDLPGAEKEIEGSLTVAENYVLLKGKDATKKNVLPKIRDCDVAYFATHGISGDVNPLDNNFLVLAGEKDPFLSARNIMALRDSTFLGSYKFPQMVILSACQTGLGKSMEAGITAGLVRAFLVAGASQVIMSLWNVDDEATAYLMNRFVHYLRQHNQFCPSEPLRLAQLDTRKKFPNPAKWASFSVFGVNY
ncbi:MAG TPA: CHAT domain-containing protein [Chitinophagaceae bacterium]|nr:CHAT domain-containing protein [Chitinophagaceae bacterium]